MLSVIISCVRTAGRYLRYCTSSVFRHAFDVDDSDVVETRPAATHSLLLMFLSVSIWGRQQAEYGLGSRNELTLDHSGW